MTQNLSNLGDGELESISIAYNSGTVNQYLILSDDDQAMKRAKYLGIQSLGIMTLIIIANQQGLLSKEK